MKKNQRQINLNNLIGFRVSTPKASKIWNWIVTIFLLSKKEDSLLTKRVLSVIAEWMFPITVPMDYAYLTGRKSNKWILFLFKPYCLHWRDPSSNKSREQQGKHTNDECSDIQQSNIQQVNVNGSYRDVIRFLR